METADCKETKLDSFIDHDIWYSSTENDCVKALFTKAFVIAENANYELPAPEIMFTEDPWQEQELQELKDKLNKVKNYLNDYTMDKWQAHTRFRNKAGNVMRYVRTYIEPELMTQAWCKFYEIASLFPLIPTDRITSSKNSFMSVHLCEAPGAFVTSLNHWLRINVPTVEWDWVATTLNPYFEGNPLSCMIDDDRFIRHTLKHWCFGADNTGDLMKLKNLDCLVKDSKKKKEVMLVTADGSIDCTEMPDEQEKNVCHLHYCEIVSMMHLLSLGGNFLLKIFTTFEGHTVSLLYLLSCCFNKVAITKPATSKEGNSETYVVCLNFKGKQHIAAYLSILREHYESDTGKAILGKTHIPESFLQKIIECSTFFTNIQCQIIMDNIETFEIAKVNHSFNSNIKRLKQFVAEEYIRICELRPLEDDGVEIVGKHVLDETTIVNTARKLMKGSYNDRINRRTFDWHKQLEELLNEAKEITFHRPANKKVLLKFKEPPHCLCLCMGKAFYEVRSSRFCKAEILKIKHEVDQILKQNNISVEFPSADAIQKSIQKIKDTKNSKILTFKYTNPYDAHSIITDICSTVQTMNPMESLVLIGYSLLTLLSVGLLYLLHHTFTSVEVRTYDNVGCVITFKRYTNNPTVLTHLHEINSYKNCLENFDERIFCIVPVSNLCGSDAFYELVDLNHRVIKSYVNHAVIIAAENTNM